MGFGGRRPDLGATEVPDGTGDPVYRACTVGYEPLPGRGIAPERGCGAGGMKWESADKPGSVVDNHPSGACVAARLERPTRKLLRAAGTGPKARVFPYLVLLQVGFAVPSNVATDAVRSYRTLSPLPSLHCCSAWAVCSLLHFPWARAPQALPGTLPCGARTFLC